MIKSRRRAFLLRPSGKSSVERDSRTTTAARGRRGSLLLRVLGLCPVDLLLLLIVLVLLVLSPLGDGYRALMRDTVGDTEGEGGPSKNLHPRKNNPISPCAQQRKARELRGKTRQRSNRCPGAKLGPADCSVRIQRTLIPGDAMAVVMSLRCARKPDQKEAGWKSK